jgi:hypothetical protein
LFELKVTAFIVLCFGVGTGFLSQIFELINESKLASMVVLSLLASWPFRCVAGCSHEVAHFAGVLALKDSVSCMKRATRLCTAKLVT